MKQKQYRYEERGSKTIRRKGIHLKLLTEEEYTKLHKRRIVGITRLKKPKKDADFLLLVHEKQFGGKKACSEKKIESCIGYISVGNHCYFKVIRPKKVFVSLAALVTVILLFGLIFFCPLKNDESPPSDEVLPTEEEEETYDWDGELPSNENIVGTQDTGSIEIPGYSEVYVTDEETEIELINPTDNTVSFVYMITFNGGVIYQSNEILPGKYIPWDPTEYFSKGTYTITFSISTYETDTKTPCNGALQSVILHVY